MSSGLLVLLLLCGLWIGGNIFSDAQTAECPPTWTSYRSRCFLFNSTEKTWVGAEVYCIDHDGHLASFHDQDEYDFIRRLIVKATGTNTIVWVGATIANEEGVWEWSDFSNFTYTHWGKGEPNDPNGGKSCMEINMNEQDYATNEHCTQENAFVCAKDA